MSSVSETSSPDSVPPADADPSAPGAPASVGPDARTGSLPERFPVFLTRACARFSRMAIRRADVAVSPVGWRVASLLDERGALRISEIAAHEHVSRPTATGTVGRLADAGLVSRTQDPSDSRSWFVDLTDAGRERLAAWRASLTDEVEALLEELSPQDTAALQRTAQILHRINSTVEGTPHRP